MPQPMLGKPFVEVQWEMLHHNPSILYFRALLLQIQVGGAAYLRHLINVITSSVTFCCNAMLQSTCHMILVYVLAIFASDHASTVIAGAAMGNVML